MYTPYCYYISWSKLDKHYYGSRTKKGCDPSDFWTKYYTSSHYVHTLVEKHGPPDVIEIRKTFDTREAALAWEHKVLRRVGVRGNDKWINKQHNQYNGRAMDPEIAERISNTLKGRYKGAKHPKHKPFTLIAELPDGSVKEYVFDGDSPNRECSELLGYYSQDIKPLKEGATRTLTRLSKKSGLPKGTQIRVR